MTEETTTKITFVEKTKNFVKAHKNQIVFYSTIVATTVLAIKASDMINDAMLNMKTNSELEGSDDISDLVEVVDVTIPETDN